jgi:hypothetical protein
VCLDTVKCGESVRDEQFSGNADRLLLKSGNIYLCLVSQEARVENAFNPGPADNIITGPADNIITRPGASIGTGLVDNITHC